MKEANTPKTEIVKGKENKIAAIHPLLAEIKGQSSFGLRIKGNFMLSLLNLCGKFLKFRRFISTF